MWHLLWKSGISTSELPCAWSWWLEQSQACEWTFDFGVVWGWQQQLERTTTPIFPSMGKSYLSLGLFFLPTFPFRVWKLKIFSSFFCHLLLLGCCPFALCFLLIQILVSLFLLCLLFSKHKRMLKSWICRKLLFLTSHADFHVGQQTASNTLSYDSSQHKVAFYLCTAWYFGTHKKEKTPSIYPLTNENVGQGGH